MFKLRGLDDLSDYIITNLDDKKPKRIAGKKLMEDGLAITIPDKPNAVVITYKKVE